MRVLNKRTHEIPEGAVYVGRPSKWGNPFPVRYGGASREEVIRRYKTWLLETPAGKELQKDLHELRGKDLVCWCAPQKCHADILVEIANEG